MARKKTQRMYFEELLNLCNQIGDTELADFVEDQISKLDKKKEAAKIKLTPRQIENNAYKEIILNGMNKGEAYTIDDMLMYFGLPLEFSHQRVSALLSQLIEAGEIARCEKVRQSDKPTFRLITN